MNNPCLPNWVTSVCCIAPFLALLVVSASGLIAGTMNFVGIACLTTLCGKILQWILNPNSSLAPENRIGK